MAAALQYLFQTQQPVGAALALPAGLFQPGQAIKLVHGGSAAPAWAECAANDGALLSATHLREVDMAALAAYPPAVLLFSLYAAQSTLLPDIETLLDTLRPKLPGTAFWVDATGLLGHVPLYTDAWHIDRCFCYQEGQWYGTGLLGTAASIPAGWQSLATTTSLPQAWNATQQRAQRFRTLLHHAGGKLFGAVTTHAFTCFRAPLIGLPPGTAQHFQALIGTGQSEVYRLAHTAPQEALLEELAALWT